MEIARGSNCESITIISNRIKELIDVGGIQYIQIGLTYNCCKDYTINIVPDFGDCEWDVYVDWESGSILNPADLIQGITRIEGFYRASPADPYALTSIVDDLYDLTDAASRNQLRTDVEAWMVANSVSGDFDIIEESPTLFILRFSNLSTNFFPVRFRTDPVASGFLDGIIINQYFRCDGSGAASVISNFPANLVFTPTAPDVWAISMDTIEIYPALMGNDKFPDGVYSISMTIVTEDGTSVTLNECLLMDCELPCKIANMGKEEAAFYYYLLKELSDCDCDCSIMCEILSLQIMPE